MNTNGEKRTGQMVGRMEHIVYASPTSSYVVARLRVAGEQEPITIVGGLREAQPGMTVWVRGRWVEDAKYGRQFKVEQYEYRADSDAGDIPAPQADMFRGHIEHITYTNETNGYTVAKLRVAGRKEPVTIVGNMADPQIGQELMIRGEWVSDRRYGRQFRIACSEYKAPSTEDGVRLYLQSDQFKGVGKKYADRIVDHFGAETARILDEEPERVKEVPGIGAKRAQAITDAWGANREIREVMLFLQSHGVSAAHAVRIFKHYGRGAIRAMTENPYRLALEVKGFGFQTADHVARKLGFPKDSEMRAEAGAFYMLDQLAGQGNVYYPMDELVGRCCKMLDIQSELVIKGITALASGGRAVIDTTPEGGKAVFLKKLHLAELGVTELFHRLLRTPKSVEYIDTRGIEKKVRTEMGISLAAQQVEAVKKAAASKVLVITGGPGTGKTTIINVVLSLYGKKGGKVLLAAPTGRAAKRMAEATGKEASTIHRMLEFNQAEGGFARDEDNPLNCGLLIVDEASMIDIGLMHSLLKAVPPGATLILVGDVNQLPSVGPGNVLGDIIRSGAVPVARLTEIFRQAAESSIIVNAHMINRGTVPCLEPPSEGLTDFYFIEKEEPEEAQAMVLDLVKNHIPRRFHFDSMDEIQVLVPMHRGEVGGTALNEKLQEVLNPEGDEVTRRDRTFRVGDKVMQVRNNYEKEVFNGDIGRVIKASAEGRELIAKFEERSVHYEANELDELMPAYAVSIHKSQGSEYPAVVVPLLTQHYIMLQRNLVYTAVTRGKKLVILVGSRKALEIAVKNNIIERRHTLLAERLAKKAGTTPEPLDGGSVETDGDAACPPAGK